MFGVLISYLPNFNVGQGNGIGNANDSQNNGTASTEEHKSSISEVLCTYTWRRERCIYSKPALLCS